LRVRQRRAVEAGAVPFLLDRVAEDMAERLNAVLRELQYAADIGTPGDRVCGALSARVRELACVDLPVDESEAVGLSPGSLDLAVSGLAFQFVNDLPGLLVQIRRALKPDGLL